MLVGNYGLSNRVISRQFNGTTLDNYGLRNSISPVGTYKNRYVGGFEKQNGTPNGYGAPGSWVLPLIAGSISSYKQLDCNIQKTSAGLAAGINIDATLTSSIVLNNANLQLIANLISSISASINITSAQISTLASLEAAISSSMTITNAQLGAIVDLATSVGCAITISNAGILATASLSADMSLNTGFATPQQIAAEVWDTILTDHQIVGSTGKALNDAGSAGNPWSALKAANNDPGTFGEELQGIKPNTDLIPAAL